MRPFIISTALLVVAEDAWPNVSQVLSDGARRKFVGAKSPSGVRIRALCEFALPDIISAVLAGARIETGEALVGKAPDDWDCSYKSVAFRLRHR